MNNLCAQFKLFGVPHIVYLLVSIAIIVTLVMLLRKQDKNVKFYVSKILVGVSALFVVLEFVGKLIADNNIFDSLPLTPWGIFVILAIYVEIKQSESWIKFGYLISLPVCVVSLFIVPNYFTTISATSIATISYFIVNTLMASYSLLKLFWSETLLEMKDILNSSINYVIIIAFVHILNVFARFTTLGVHSNFFGTMGDNYDVVVNLLYGWIPVPLVQILPLIAILVGIEFLLFLPFNILKTRKHKKAQMEELIALGNMKAQQEVRNSKKATSQVLVRSEEKARPEKEKNVTQKNSGGFLAVNKEVQVNKEEKK